MKKKCLFLGYNAKETKLIRIISEKGYVVHQFNKKITLKKLNKYSFIISYGYRHLISQNIIKKLKKPIINLHISYLPYNRGSNPNFWSFIENTPSGVSIHEIDFGIDTGPIIFQKLIDFDLIKNKKKLTFNSTYKILKKEVENLFISKIDLILNNKYKKYKQRGTGSVHLQSEMPKNFRWNQNIFSTINKIEKLKHKTITRKNEIIKNIEITRKRNNLNWMDLLKIAMDKSPKQTTEILKKINNEDDLISSNFKKLIN